MSAADRADLIAPSDWRRSGLALVLFAPPLCIYGLQSWAGVVAGSCLLFCLIVTAQLAWRGQLHGGLAALRNSAVLGMLGFPVAVIVIIVLFGGEIDDLDTPSRFLLLVPVALVIARLRPAPGPWFLANAAGGALGGLLALNQVVVQGLPLASGLLDNPNKFAYLTTVSAVVCLAAMRLDQSDRPPLYLLWPGFALGVTALLLSSTRGAWLAFCMALGGWFVLSRSVRLRTRLLLLAVVVGGAVLLASLEGQVIAQRWTKIGTELSQYLDGNWQESSIGERFELWRGAAIMIGENPLAGVGLGEYNKHLQQLVAQGRLNPQIADHGHAHNEPLMWWAVGGLPGLIGMLGLLFGPLFYFVRHAARASRLGGRNGSPAAPALRRYQAGAIAGSLVATVTLVFCLFDAFFYIQFATVYYALTAYILIGLVEAYRQ